MAVQFINRSTGTISVTSYSVTLTYEGEVADKPAVAFSDAIQDSEARAHIEAGDLDLIRTDDVY